MKEEEDGGGGVVAWPSVARPGGHGDGASTWRRRRQPTVVLPLGTKREREGR